MWTRWRIQTLAGLLIGLASAALASSVAPRAVADERQPVSPDDEMWRAVGRINQGNGAFCTGALIEPDLVVTAAHCLFHPITGRRLQPGSVHFLAGWAKGAFVAHRKGAAIALSPGFDPGAEPTLAIMAADIALVRLAEPISADLAQPFPVASPQEGEADALVVSYARDRAHLASLERCRAAFPTRPRRPAIANCASVEGASGAPLMLQTDAGYAVAAVVSGRQGEGGGARAVATPLHPQLNSLRALLD